MDRSLKFAELGGIGPVAGSALVPCDERVLVGIEARIGADLPLEYREFLAHYGASCFGAYVDYRPLNPLPLNVSRNNGHFAFFFGAASGQYDETFSLAWNLSIFAERMPATMLPIGGDGGGNLICLGYAGDDAGKVFHWDHSNEWDEDDLDDDEPLRPDLKYQNITLVAKSFSEFLDRLLVSDRA